MRSARTRMAASTSLIHAHGAARWPRRLRRLADQRGQARRAQGRAAAAPRAHSPMSAAPGRPRGRPPVTSISPARCTRGSALSCSRSAVSSAGVRMPRRSWLTLATTVPSAASLALRHSAARSSCCIAASSCAATAISSFDSTVRSSGIERCRPLGIGAECGDAAGDPPHRPHQQQRAPPDRPARRSRRRPPARGRRNRRRTAAACGSGRVHAPTSQSSDCGR